MSHECQAGVCEGLCTGEAARQCYLRTLGEMDQTKARFRHAQSEAERQNRLRDEANAAFSNWLSTRDQVAAAEIQKLLNTWPDERAADGQMYLVTPGVNRNGSSGTPWRGPSPG